VLSEDVMRKEKAELPSPLAGLSIGVNLTKWTQGIQQIKAGVA